MPIPGIVASAVVPAAAGVDVLMEPFNNLTAWSVFNGSPTIVTGRTGTAARLPSNAILDYTIPAVSESDTVTVGFAFQTENLGSNADLCAFMSDSKSTEHGRLQVVTSGAVQVTRGASTFLGASAAGLIAINTWNYIECQIKLHDTAGTVTVRVNGATVLTLTGQDTKNGGTKTVYDSIRLRYPSASFANLFDDLYITMGAGAPFKGSITIP